MPKRIQMTRQRPWRRDHPDAVIVARPSKWGNPFTVGETGVPNARVAVSLFQSVIQLTEYFLAQDDEMTMRCNIIATEFGTVLTPEFIRTELRGKDLACWCALDQPCHADVLLEIANAES